MADLSESIAENVADVVTSATDGIIADAQDNAAAAIETAEQIAAAALELARNNQIGEIQRGLEQCQTTLSMLPSQMEARLSELLSQALEGIASVNRESLTDLESRVLSEMEARMASSASTLPILPAELVTPELIAPAPAEPAPAPSAPARKRRFL